MFPLTLGLVVYATSLLPLCYSVGVMPLDYKAKPTLEEFSYYLVENTAHVHSAPVLQEFVLPAIAQVKEEYAIEFTVLRYGEVPHDETYSYVLYVATNPLTMSTEEHKYLRKLGSVAHVNVVSAFPLEDGQDTEIYTRNSHKIPLWAAELGVNVIYPDNIVTDLGVRTVDQEDIQDNIICETVRVKYSPVVSSDHSLDDVRMVHKEYQETIEQLRSLYDTQGLWHRDRTDGALMMRTDRGFLVSQTKTDKTTMTAEQFSVVDGWDVGMNEVSYAGSKIPSSDAPEFLVFAELLAQKGNTPTLFIHFHHNGTTRGDRFREYVTSMKIEYGQFFSGTQIFEEAERVGGQWLILREHGILWWGDTVEEFEDFIIRTLKFLQV